VKFAVVIPALDEAFRISGTIASALAPDTEVVVVDGGSSDETVFRAREAGARVAVTERGRGRQLQAGVEATQGDLIVFLHADTRLPEGWDSAIREVAASRDVAGGAFRLRLDGAGIGLRFIEWAVRARVALFSYPYGDQAIFVKRPILEAIGGVPNVPVMEDLDLVRAVKSRGRFANLDLSVLSSARRYVDDGMVRTVARHALALAGWMANFDRDRVARWLQR
jgi:rSAM/selenodomain-associated transferase 2